MNQEIEIRECVTLDELHECVKLQQEVFSLPDIELSPVRHLVVTKNAGGFTLGAYAGGELAGFVLSVPAFYLDQRAYYSHMTAVRRDMQGAGVGAKLKWAQRDRSLNEGVKLIRWTFEPWKSRNAFLNLEKLGAVIARYERDFYGTDYNTAAVYGRKIGLASDRLFADWVLDSEKVEKLAAGENYRETAEPAGSISVPSDWFKIVEESPDAAVAIQQRMRADFEEAFAKGLIVRAFDRNADDPRYVLFEK